MISLDDGTDLPLRQIYEVSNTLNEVLNPGSKSNDQDTAQQEERATVEVTNLDVDEEDSLYASATAKQSAAVKAVGPQTMDDVDLSHLDDLLPPQSKDDANLVGTRFVQPVEVTHEGRKAVETRGK
jgi:hypothetical protein